MIAGIYGMNFKHMPELEWTFGYPMVLGAIAGIDAFFSRASGRPAGCDGCANGLRRPRGDLDDGLLRP